MFVFAVSAHTRVGEMIVLVIEGLAPVLALAAFLITMDVEAKFQQYKVSSAKKTTDEVVSPAPETIPAE